MAARVTMRSVVRVPESTAAREIDTETVILNLESGIYFGIDEVGTCIWRVIAAGGSLADAERAILDEYDVEPARLESDLLRFVQDLADRMLVMIEER